MSTIPTFECHVSEEIIKNSKRQDSRHCMISEALRQKGASSTNVTADSARFNYKGKRYSFPLPAVLKAKLLAFDSGIDLAPFDFRLNGNMGYCAPMAKRPEVKRGPTKKRAKHGERLIRPSPRRFHGLQMIQVVDNTKD
jgi:hypothetical protein